MTALEKFKEKVSKKEKEERVKFLRENGIYDRIPTPNNEYQPGCSSVYEDGRMVYYTRKYPEMSDKEYADLKTKLEKRELDGWKDAFKSYASIPTIIFVLIMVFSIIFTIIDGAIGLTGVAYIWIIIGFILGLTISHIVKCAIAPIILQTKYLEIIIRKLEEDDE